MDAAGSPIDTALTMGAEETCHIGKFGEVRVGSDWIYESCFPTVIT